MLLDGRIVLKNTENTGKDEDGWGWGKYISHNEYFDLGNNILPEDKLTILCKVSIYIYFVLFFILFVQIINCSFLDECILQRG